MFDGQWAKLLKAVPVCEIVLLQHVCRSATISSGAEMYGRRVFDMFSGTENQTVSATSDSNRLLALLLHFLIYHLSLLCDFVVIQPFVAQNGL